MGLIKCPECGKDISDQAEACPNCGYPIRKKLEEKAEEKETEIIESKVEEKTEETIVEEKKDSKGVKNTEINDVIQSLNESKDEKKEEKKKNSTAGWAICVITILLAISMFDGFKSILSVIMMTLAGIIACPKFIEYLKEKHNININKTAQIITFIALVILAAYFTPSIQEIDDKKVEESSIVSEESVNESKEKIKEETEEAKQKAADEAKKAVDDAKKAAEDAKKKAEEEAQKAIEDAKKKAEEEAAAAEAQKKAEEAKAAEEAQKATDEKTYKASCEKIAYKDIARNPDKYVGKNVKFTGQVVQVQEDVSFFGKSNSITMRVAVTKGSYGIWDDYVYCTYTYSEGESKVLEDDIITFYGECKGDTSYVSVLGSNITLPEVAVKYLTIDE